MPGWRERLGRFWRHPAASGEQGFTQSQLENQPLRREPRGPGTGSFWGGTYDAHDTTEVNYEKARALYANSLPAYKLGAGFSRPIINSSAGFMGVPTFSHAGDVEPVNDALTEFFEGTAGVLYLAQRDAMRDGDCYLRLEYGPDPLDPNEANRFTLEQLVPDLVTPVPKVIGQGWAAVIIEHPYTPPYPERPYVILETITAQQITFEVKGEARAEVKAEFDGRVDANPWGLIPIVHFKNEGDAASAKGKSDLEPLEPFFRAYHDTLLVGLGGIQWFAKPKAVFNLADVDGFLEENMPEALKQGGVPNFQGRDLFLMSLEDKVSFLTANPGTEGVAKLLEILFLNIVDTSETPEFVMGGAVASSKASVSEQMTPFIKKIERKRLMFTDSHRELAAKFLSMATRVGEIGGALETYAVNLTWPEVASKDEQATANTIKTLVDSFVAAVEAGLISAESASDFMAQWVTTMLPWKDEEGGDLDERAKIIEGMEFLDEAKAIGTPAPLAGAPPTPFGRPGGAGPTPPGGSPVIGSPPGAAPASPPDAASA